MPESGRTAYKFARTYDLCFIERDFRNAVDKNACGVYTVNSQTNRLYQIGYIGRDYAKDLVEHFKTSYFNKGDCSILAVLNTKNSLNYVVSPFAFINHRDALLATTLVSTNSSFRNEIYDFLNTIKQD